MSEATFDSLGLAPAFATACAQAGFRAPTPIQAQAIPLVLQGLDVLGLAPTGSGKTAAFALPLLQRLRRAAPSSYRRPVQVLVLVPTRELAAQVGEVFGVFGRGIAPPLRIAVLFGGVSINPQMMALRGGADVVVATPGRLLDLLDHNAINLSKVQALVLDEADRMLDLGFAEELQRVLAALPDARQNLLFSATFADEVQALAGSLLRDAVRVESHEEVQPQPDIAQRVIEVDEGRRAELLRHLVRQDGWRRALVFVATRHACEHLARKLSGWGIPAAAFHGEMSQGARTEVLEAFKLRRSDVLVTTDLAARGIDVQGLEVVVNYDLPRSATQYVHRIGRTGRAGTAGLAVSFVGAATLAHWRLIEARNGLALPREQVPGFEPVDAPPPPVPNTGNGGVKGARPSRKAKLRAAAAAAARAGPKPGPA